MKIAIIGLWHLGSVMAACLASRGHFVFAYDPDEAVRENLRIGKAPIFEPELNELLQKGLMSHQLKIINDLSLLKTVEIIWITFDTPVNELDQADVKFIQNEVIKIAPFIQENTLLLVSSQLPIGSTKYFKKMISDMIPEINFSVGYIPENLRLGKAIPIFLNPDRVIVGLERAEDKIKIVEVFKLITSNLIWMSIESAEMTKHALNAFLATSIVFINEIAVLCEQYGADAAEIEQGLKSEERIGAKAYLRAGEAIAGGTLLRDVHFLNELAKDKNIHLPLVSGILHSNNTHKQWLFSKIHSVFSELNNKVIAILGLTYKPNTDTLRRSVAVEMAQYLYEQGAIIKAYDPMIQCLPDHLKKVIQLTASEEEALDSSDAFIIATPHLQFKNDKLLLWIDKMKQKNIFDPMRFLNHFLENVVSLNYYSIGKTI